MPHTYKGECIVKKIKAVLTLVLVFCTSLVMAQAPSSYPQGRGPLLNPNSQRVLLEALGVKPVSPLIMQEFGKALDEHDVAKLEALLQQHPGIVRQPDVSWNAICRPENCSWKVVNVFVKFGMNVNTPDHYGTTLLMLAADYQSLEVARNIIAKTNVNAKDKSGHPALFFAMRNSSVELVKLLLNHGAKPDLQDLFLAIEIGRPEIVQELLKDPSIKKDINKKNSDDETALWYAVNKSVYHDLGINDSDIYLPIMKILLANGADPNIRCHLTIGTGRENAWWRGKDPVGKILGTTPLSLTLGKARVWDRIDVLRIKKLIDYGALLRENMWKPSALLEDWHVIALHEHPAHMPWNLSDEQKAEQIALRREAIEYMQTKSAISHQQLSRFVFLSVGAWPDDQALDFMKWALNNGWYFDKRHSDEGTLDNLLIEATKSCSYNTAAYLLGNGADVNTKEKENLYDTPLHIAFLDPKIYGSAECKNESDRAKIISLLMKYGPDLSIENLWRNTPLDLAEQMKEAAIRAGNQDRVKVVDDFFKSIGYTPKVK